MSTIMRPMQRLAITLIASSGLAACALLTPRAETASVPAQRETQPVESLRDAADDPAIWRNAADPSKSLIVGTDKKAGLHLYALDGRHLDYAPAGRMNNVDLRANVSIAGKPGVLIAASDRNDNAHGAAALYQLDTEHSRLLALGKVDAQLGEAYGMCLYRAATGDVYAFVVAKDGLISQLALDLSAATPSARVVRQLKLKTQSEGCVVDDRTAQLYVGEENVGIWRFDAAPDGATTATRFAAVDGQHLVADVEGLALAALGERGGYLLASSQGDSAYAVYRLEDGAYAGRFHISNNANGVDGTSETDGIELALGDFGPDFSQGLFIAQDGDNGTQPQNFKLLSWARIAETLKLNP